MPIWSGPLHLAPSKIQKDGASIASFLTCFRSQPLKSTDGQPRTALQSTAPSNPSTQPRQHQKSVIERSKQSSVHTLMHKKKDRVSSAGSRQSQRAGPTRACAAPASNPLGVSSKIVITMKRMRHFGRASSRPCDPAIPCAVHPTAALLQFQIQRGASQPSQPLSTSSTRLGFAIASGDGPAHQAAGALY